MTKKPVLYYGPFGVLHTTVREALLLDADAILFGAQFVMVGQDGLQYRIDPRQVRPVGDVELQA
jgi:hypothetical protein